MIEYRIGDATDQASGIIAHVVNDVGAWGAGFSGAVGRRFPVAERSYRDCFLDRGGVRLGNVAICEIKRGLRIAHLFAQHGIGRGQRRVDYDALALCLQGLNSVAGNAGIHMPRIGTGYGGGNWDTISALIEGNIESPVFVYDLEKK